MAAFSNDSCQLIFSATIAPKSLFTVEEFLLSFFWGSVENFAASLRHEEIEGLRLCFHCRLIIRSGE